MDVLIIASSKYWTDAAELNAAVRASTEAVSTTFQSASTSARNFRLITSEEDTLQKGTSKLSDAAIVIPFSGGVQRILQRLGSVYKRIGLLNAYLPDSGFPEALALRLLQLNAHPAAADFWAYQNRNGREIYWLSNLREALDFAVAAQAVKNLQGSRLLLIGETESWVLNSCRDPEVFKRRLGVEIIPITLDDLIEACPSPDAGVVDYYFKQIRPAARLADGVGESDIREACAPIAGIWNLVEQHRADGFALGCFSMIPLLKTTGCLALGYFNGMTPLIGACEGDLDAAATLRLVKNLGAKHAWMGNPIIFADNTIQLAHCTASWRWGEQELPLAIKRHHESGLGAAPLVSLPEGRSVILTRIGGDLREIVIVSGTTMPPLALPTCRTQQRISIASSSALLKALTGTHLISVNGELLKALTFAARMMELKITGDVSDCQK